jgi:outer membrane receptor protein involved in Fe transport
VNRLYGWRCHTTSLKLATPGGLASLNAPSFIPGPTGSNGGAPNAAQQINGGNPNLVPEKANTLAAGIVFTPDFLPGLTASVDWYQIHLHGAISSVLLASKIARCQAGETVWCSQIVFQRQGSFMAAQGCGSAGVGNFCQGADTTSPILYVYNSPLNAALMTTAGFDFSVAYGFDLFTGQMDVSFNGNYVYDYSRTLEGIYFQGAGGTASYYNGGPNFQGNLSFDYREGPWSFGTTFRITGDSLMDLGNQGNPAIAEQGVTYVRQGGVDVASVGAGQRNLLTGAETNYNATVVRTDLRVQYRWSNNITLFGAVDNVQNLPTAGGILRRSYRMGVRFNY